VKERAVRRTAVGMVVSDKMDKTVVVRVERRYLDGTYKKYVRSFARLKAHDEENGCHVGDKVRVVESRPLSKHKRWIVQAKLAEALPQ